MRAPRPWLLLAAVLWLALRGGPARAAETGFALAGATDLADVYLDGDKIGTTPLPGVVPCPGGEHTIRVVRPGYAPYIDVFKVREGRVTRIEVELAPVSGVLRLSVNVDKARVFLDGQFVGEAPLESDLKIGPHQLRVARFGYRERSVTVTAVAGKVEELKLRLEELPEGENPYKPAAPPPPKWYERWWVWTAGAGAVAAVAVAVIVPVVYSTRSPCDRLGAAVCIPVPAPGAGQAALVGVSF
jgi:hypothetical protein